MKTEAQNGYEIPQIEIRVFVVVELPTVIKTKKNKLENILDYEIMNLYGTDSICRKNTK